MRGLGPVRPPSQWTVISSPSGGGLSGESGINALFPAFGPGGRAEGLKGGSRGEALERGSVGGRAGADEFSADGASGGVTAGRGGIAELVDVQPPGSSVLLLLLEVQGPATLAGLVQHIQEASDIKGEFVMDRAERFWGARLQPTKCRQTGEQCYGYLC